MRNSYFSKFYEVVKLSMCHRNGFLSTQPTSKATSMPKVNNHARLEKNYKDKAEKNGRINKWRGLEGKKGQVGSCHKGTQGITDGKKQEVQGTPRPSGFPGLSRISDGATLRPPLDLAALSLRSPVPLASGCTA